VVHGRYDILAAPKHAEALARKMCCRLVMVEAAHFITRECGTELNSLLRAIIFPAQVPVRYTGARLCHTATGKLECKLPLNPLPGHAGSPTALQSLHPQHYMETAAGSEVQSMRAPSQVAIFGLPE
jgi:hypothetical protein